MAEKVKKVPSIDFEECAGCSVCIENCPKNCLALTEPRYHGDTHTAAALILKEACIGCGICSRVCPIDAITMKEEGKEML